MTLVLQQARMSASHASRRIRQVVRESFDFSCFNAHVNFKKTDSSPSSISPPALPPPPSAMGQIMCRGEHRFFLRHVRMERSQLKKSTMNVQLTNLPQMSSILLLEGRDRTGSPFEKVVRREANCTKGVQVEKDRGEVTTQELDAIVADIEENLALMNSHFTFAIDSDSKEAIVQVVDRDTGRVIRQIPPEELLHIRTAFKEPVSGILLNRQA